jgi:uncharacterized protein with HEPN domain
MTTFPDDRVYLQHILESIKNVEDFTANNLDGFHEIPMAWFATIRALQIMSESATKLSEKSKLKMTAIEWQRIRGFRNILVHDYLGDIDYKIIRAVIEIELPKLKQASEKMLVELGTK